MKYGETNPRIQTRNKEERERENRKTNRSECEKSAHAIPVPLKIFLPSSWWSIVFYVPHPADYAKTISCDYAI